MNQFQEMGCNDIFKSFGFVTYFRPIRKIKLGFLFQGSIIFTDKRINSKTIIEGLEDIEPVRHGPVTYLQVFPDGIHGQERCDPVGKNIAEKLHSGHIPYLLDVPDILAKQSVVFFVLPSAQSPFILFDKWLRESPEFIQSVEHIGRTGRAYRQFMVGEPVSGGCLSIPPLKRGAVGSSGIDPA